MKVYPQLILLTEADPNVNDRHATTTKRQMTQMLYAHSHLTSDVNWTNV